MPWPGRATALGRFETLPAVETAGPPGSDPLAIGSHLAQLLAGLITGLAARDHLGQNQAAATSRPRPALIIASANPGSRSSASR
jgi:hypothetical protein